MNLHAPSLRPPGALLFPERAPSRRAAATKGGEVPNIPTACARRTRCGRGPAALRALLLLGLLLAARPAPAQVVADGQTNTLNGVTNTVTGSVTVGANGSYTLLTLINGGTLVDAFAYVGFNGNASNNQVTVTGTGSVWDNSGGSLFVGHFGSFNALLITNGGQVADGTGIIGNQAGASNNRVTVTGTNSLWANSSFSVGGAGSFNSLLISNGGTVADNGGYLGNGSDGSNNQVTVTGTNSLWTNSGVFYVGSFGSFSTLLITKGGRVASGSGHVGSFSGANYNQVIVAGTNSVWANNGVVFSVGDSSSFNQVLITNGGRLENKGFAVIGNDTAAINNQITVTGTNSVWTNSSDFYVGSYGSFNTVLITNGGAVQAAGAYVGVNTGSNNLLSVGNGTLTVTNGTGDAVLDVRRGRAVFNGGTISPNRLVITNASLDGGGTFQFNAGTLNVGGVTNANGRPFVVGDGANAATFQLLGGTHFFSDGLVLATNALLKGTGGVLGAVTNFGTIAPGNSPGALTFNGSLSLQASATLALEIGGLIPTNQYDVLTVTNFVQLAGTLRLSLLNNFLPAPADTFTVLNFGSASGGFANVAAGRVSLSNNLASFAVTQSATSLTLGGVTYADTDGDGQGDLQELAAGTDPNSSASGLAVTALARNGSDFPVLTFQSVAGKNYRIEFSNDLVTWSPATTNIPATNASTAWTDDGSLTGGLNAGTTQRFYRVGLQ